MAQLNGAGRDGYDAHGPDASMSDIPVTHLKASTASKGHVLALDAVDSSGDITTVYLWVTSSGTLCISKTFPTTTESGTAVGSQS